MIYYLIFPQLLDFHPIAVEELCILYDDVNNNLLIVIIVNIGILFYNTLNMFTYFVKVKQWDEGNEYCFHHIKYLKDDLKYFSCYVCLLEVHSDEWKEENEKRKRKKDIYIFKIWGNGHQHLQVFKEGHQDSLLTIIPFASIILKTIDSNILQ